MKNLIPVKKNVLTAAQFEKLGDVPPELEWLANIEGNSSAATVCDQPDAEPAVRQTCADRPGSGQRGHSPGAPTLRL